MKEWPLVSIITPSYNQGHFIEETINSVLDQKYPNLEYIIIDGCSTDNSLSIIKKYERRLKWISEQDYGQSNAINKGFRLAKGDIVAWLNSDDTYMPGAVNEAVEYFKHHNVALVYGEGNIIDEHGKKVKRFEATQSFDLWTLVNVWDYIMQPTTFFKKEALASIGYLDESLHWTMDWDLWIRLAKKFEVGYINKILANSREYEETKTSTGSWKRFAEICKVLRRYGEKRYPPAYFIYGASTLYANNAHYKLGRIITSKILYLVQTHFQRKLLTKI